MRVAVYRGPHELDIEERPVPAVGPHDLLLEVSHCGICGSDIHFVLEGWGRPGSIEGHEYAGRVVAVGDAVTDWQVGDTVVGGPSPRCGTCEYCRAGRPSLCSGRSTPGQSIHADGAFAEYTLVPDHPLIAQNTTLPSEVRGALPETSLTSAGSLQPSGGETLLLRGGTSSVDLACSSSPARPACA